MHKPHSPAYYRFALLTFLVAIIVVLLGNYARLSHAGLSCPHWPACFGHLFITHHDTPNYFRAWLNLSHRYGAFALACLLGILFLTSLAKFGRLPLLTPFLLVLCVIAQAALGAATVTENLLPAVVSAHFLGGFVIIALLWVLVLETSSCNCLHDSRRLKGMGIWSLLGVLMLLIQVVLGIWTSTHHANFACPDFPSCITNGGMQWDFANAFAISAPQSALTQAGMMTIQMTHRVWALITFIYLALMSLCFITAKGQAGMYRWLGLFLLLAMIGQVALGIVEIDKILPFTAALAHNLLAIVVLLCLLTISFSLYAKTD